MTFLLGGEDRNIWMSNSVGTRSSNSLHSFLVSDPDVGFPFTIVWGTLTPNSQSFWLGKKKKILNIVSLPFKYLLYVIIQWTIGGSHLYSLCQPRSLEFLLFPCLEFHFLASFWDLNSDRSLIYGSFSN